MSSSNHVMVDLETVDNVPTAAIVSIGAVIFAGPRNGETFYAAVDMASAIAAGLTVSDETMGWWAKQSSEAKAVFSDPERVSVASALSAFGAWLPRDAKIWGNGASFDNAILANAYRRISRPLPWKFWNDRCYRTVAVHLPPREQHGTHHNALDDAKSQARHLATYGESFIK